MKIYPASKSVHYDIWLALQACGLHLSGDWPRWPFNSDRNIEPTSRDWADHSAKCLRQAAECDVLLMYVRPSEQHFGSLLEAGAALGAGKQVYLVAAHDWPFLRHHPNVRSFATLADAVSAIRHAH